MMMLFNFIGKQSRFSLCLACLAAAFPLAVLADNCAVCSQPIYGQIYLATDEVTGQQVEVCSNCVFNLPRCYICGLPIKEGDELKLPDGRRLCGRDAKTVVVNSNDVVKACADVRNDLDRLFSRFTSFPDNVDVKVIDRIDVDAMFDTSGHDVESPDLLGCIKPVTEDGIKRYQMSLMIGMPLAQLKETSAHEYSHAWVGENVSQARHERMDGDAEEGFCEMVGYLVMDSQGEEVEKLRVLKNQYTRGQVKLFIEAEQRYGFDQILDWMRAGVTPRLDEDHLEAVRDIQVSPVARPPDTSSAIPARLYASRPSVPPPPGLHLQGIMWGNQPCAIINGRSFFVNNVQDVKVDGTNMTIRCEAIQHNLVRIENVLSGKSQDLVLSQK